MVTATQAATPASARPAIAGPGPDRPTRRDLATASVASPPSSPTNAGANTRPAGRTAPVASAAAAIAATASAPAIPTAARLPRGGKEAARAQPAANRHRDGLSCTRASSAVMARPQSRWSVGSVAAAAASSHPGPSREESRAPARRHQARHSSQAASIQGVPKTAIQIAMSSRTWAVSGSRALFIWRTQSQAKGVAAAAEAASPPRRPMRLVRFMCPPAAVAARARRQPGPPSAPAARPPVLPPAPGRDR